MDQDFERELLGAFAQEAADHVRGITAGLLDMENGVTHADGEPLIVRVYRQAHSLKGAARTVGLAEVESVCHAMETVLGAMKSASLAASPELYDKLQAAVQVVDEWLESGQGDEALAESTASQLMRVLETKLPLPTEAAGPQPDRDRAPLAAQPAKTKAAAAGHSGVFSGDATVRVQARMLEGLFAQSEELLSAAFASRQRLAETRSLAARLDGWRKAIESAELSGNAPPMCEQVGAMVRSLCADARQLDAKLTSDYIMVERQARDLLATARSALLQPFGGLFEPCHKVVRDLAREQGKSIELLIEGADLSVDRRILEAMRDPLIHLIRNACDHGAELPPQRRAAGKAEKTQIRLQAVPMGTDHVELRVIDDGGGVDPLHLRQKAVALGLYSEEELASWSDEAVLDLAFTAELSTAASVTTLSGRGLGLAIVRQSVESIGGSVAIRSRVGQGTAFILRLPVSLSTFRGVIVVSAGQVFALPSPQVERVVPYRPSDEGTVAGLPMFGVEGAQLPTLRLSQLLGLADSRPVQTETAVVVAAGGRRVALRVDAVLAEEEGLAKGLGKQLCRVRGISGVANFSQYSLIPIIQLADLLSAPAAANLHLVGSGAAPLAPQTQGQRERPQRTICVAEDSATARHLVVHILEKAGYRVCAAENGADALGLLRTDHCDALVSDVEMPVLDGFALTEAIRADARLHDLPVVLLTSLESREYRDRGSAVGANAYVVKRNFDPEWLLAALERLL